MQTENGVKDTGSPEAWLASADLTGKENYLVSYDSSSGVALTDAANDTVAGLILNAATIGTRADIRPWIPGGVYKPRVSAAVVEGAFLQLDSATPGALVTFTTGVPIAVALEATSGAGNCRVLALANRGLALGSPAPVTLNATGTMAAGDILAGKITTTTAAAVAGTTRTGTQLTAEMPHVVIGASHFFTVINTGPSTFTLTAGTDVTIVGSAAVATVTSGRFEAKRTAATTWVIYRH